MNQQAMPSAPLLTTSPVWGLKTSTPFHLDTQLAVLFGDEVDVRLAEDDEEIAFAGVLEVLGHVQVGVHAGLEHGDAAQLVELGGVRLVVEGAGDEHIETGIARLAGGGDEVGALHGAELGADEDGGALLGVAFQVTAFAADQFAGPGGERGEGDLVLLVRLLHAGGLEVLQDHLRERLLGSVFSAWVLQRIDQLVVFVHTEHTVRTEALHGEWTGDADFLVVRVRLVVEIFKLGLGGDGGVDLLLPGNACLPPVGVQFRWSFGPRVSRAFR